MLNRIGEFVSAFFGQLLDVLEWLLSGFVYIVSEIFYLIFDVILTVLEGIINAIDFAQLTALTAFSDWGLLPDQILYVLGRLNFAQALAILSSAYLIRLTLNLIPAAFTRV